MSSDLVHRYSEYEGQDVQKRWDEGGRYVIELEKLGQDLGRRLFGAKYVELRAISGHVAILSCVLAFVKSAGLNLELSTSNGGHGTSDLSIRSSAFNYRTEALPFDVEEWNVDVDKAKKKILTTRPDVVTLGSSFYIFPHPVREISEAAREVGAKVVYDGSHVLGLIAGKQWPDPLVLGANVVSASTHKSFAGPQKAIILSNEEDSWAEIANILYPGLTTNHHLANVAALVYSMVEYLEFGEALASQIVKNSRALGRSLAEDYGFDVIGGKNGYSQSHQVLVRTEKILSGKDAAALLDKSNIICNKMELEGAQGLRLGTSEVTRLGMKEKEMSGVSDFINQVLHKRKDPSRVIQEVREFVKPFGKIHYSFEENSEAYSNLFSNEN